MAPKRKGQRGKKRKAEGIFSCPALVAQRNARETSQHNPLHAGLEIPSFHSQGQKSVQPRGPESREESRRQSHA
jgi:hypothetical protein